MQHIRSAGVALATALVLGVIAAPASANHAQDVGVFIAEAWVGKSGTCAQDGSGSVSGGGLGIPLLSGAKTASWKLDSSSGSVFGIPAQFYTVQHGPGLWLRACGKLAPVFPSGQGVPLGAACGISHGRDGWGEVRSYPTVLYRLRNLGWVTSAGGLVPVSGDIWIPNAAVPSGKENVGQVVALTYATGGWPCLNKTSTTAPKSNGATEGATSLNLVGTFAALRK